VHLEVAKQRRISGNKLRKAIRKQLAFVARNFRFIEQLMKQTPLKELSRRQYRNLLVVCKLYRQQLITYRNRTHQVNERIVSIYQPYIRPMVRGKVKAKVEFGAKVSMSLVNGYAMIERMQRDGFYEGVTLIESVEMYKSRFGSYPKAILADQLYRNRENLAYYKERSIRLRGPRLGRPSQQEDAKEIRRQAYEDAVQRNAIEGKFGESKRNMV
jgi:hypothetical protein